MSLRGFRIYQKIDLNGVGYIVESVHANAHLQLYSGAALQLDAEEAEELKKSYTKLADGYGVLGILRISDDLEYLILVTSVFSVGQLHGSDIYKITGVQFIQLRQATEYVDNRIVELQRLMSSGIFYFAYSAALRNAYDLTVSLSKQKNITHEGGTYGEKFTRTPDYRFFWNRNLCFPLERYGIDSSAWIVKCMAGSVLVRTIYVGHRTAKVAILSRLSCDRTGTRFNVRGANDEGHVANFVETEQLINFEETNSSFIQIRGSVPLFWEQPGIQVGSHKVKLKAFEVSMTAFERHFANLKSTYGNITTVNLLGSKEGEKMLSTAFEAALKSSSHKSDVAYIPFDYHAQMKQSKESVHHLLRKLASTISECGSEYAVNDKLRSTQVGVIRTNCLDCLDRTNAVQTLIGLKALEAQLAALEVEKAKPNISGRFEEVLRDLWQKNGDQCSVIYAGTGALEGKSKLKDASRSIARTIQNNLMDSAKQESFDLLLLGRTFANRAFDRALNVLPSTVVKEYPDALEALVERREEMCNVGTLSVFAGTWNVNGGKNMYNVAFRHEQSLDSWLFPHFGANGNTAYDIVAIGLEEIVDLNASNMMKASTTNQRVWREGLKKALIAATNEKYVCVACEQLVGVCIVVFVRPALLSHIRDLAMGEVKTGMGGATGNKGSVAVRMTIGATSLCFVCSHFAAGQYEVSNRNDDFQTAVRKIRFPMGRWIGTHDVVLWFGDFNYRISLSGDEVKSAVAAGNFERLVEYDQLTQQKAAGAAFAGFNEGPLNFAPTYKYDTFSDDYDTSEKCRAPAWTDRVLWLDATERRNAVQLLHYGRSELKTSDHRPVAAVFELSVMYPDYEKCQEVFKDVISSMGPPDATVLCWLTGCDPFPESMCQFVMEKLHELGVQVLISKIRGPYLWLILSSGVEALAALSMDQVATPSGHKLNVRFHSPGWTEEYSAKLPQLFEDAAPLSVRSLDDWTSVNLNIDEDDDENGVMVKISEMGIADDDGARITCVQVTQREANGPPVVPPRPRSALME